MRRRRHAVVPLVFLLFIGLHLGANLGRPDHHKRSEVRTAICAREMLATGNWVIPTLGGRTRFEKPPLQYWLIALAAEALEGGTVTRFASRFPSLLAGLLVLFLAWGWSRRLSERKTWYAGLFAPLVLAAAPSFFTLARSSQAEMGLCAFVLLSAYLFLRAAEEEGCRRKYLLLAYLSAAGGMLAKGPIALLMPLLPYVAVRRREALREWRIHLLGFLVAALPVGAWGVACYVSNPGAVRIFVKEMYTQQFSSRGGHYKPVYYYLIVMAEDFSLLLPFLVPAAAEAWRRKGAARFALLFFLLNFGWLTIMRAKQSHYFLPVLPGIAVLLGAWLEAHAPGPRPASFLRWAGFVLLALAAVGSIVLLPEALPWLAVTVLAAAVLHLIRRRIPLPGLFAFAVALCLAGHLREVFIAESAYNLNERRLLASWTRNQPIPPEAVAHVKPQDPLFVYYWGKPIAEVPLSEAGGKRAKNRPSFDYFVARTEDPIAALLKRRNLLPLKVLYDEKKGKKQYEYALFRRIPGKGRLPYTYRVLIVPERSEEALLASPTTMLPGIDTYHAMIPERNPFDGFSPFALGARARMVRIWRPHLEQGVELWAPADTEASPFHRLWFHNADYWGVTTAPVWERTFFHGAYTLFVLDGACRPEAGRTRLKEALARPGAGLRLVFVERAEGDTAFLQAVRAALEGAGGLLLNDRLEGAEYAAAELAITSEWARLDLLDRRGRVISSRALQGPEKQGKNTPR